MPKVVLYDKHLFTIGKNYSAFVKQMQNNKFNFILHKFNEYLQKKTLKRCCFLAISNKL